jgi:hypothetical protein
MKRLIENKEYRHSLGVSQSTLKGFAECPKYVQYLQEKEKTMPTDPMIIGLMVESILLGTKFRHEVSPYSDFRSADAKEWKRSMELEGIPIIKESMQERIATMVEAGRDEFSDVKDCDVSVGIWRDHEETGVMRRGLLDLVPRKRPVIADLKCLADPSPAGFARAVTNFRYDIQEAYYTRLWQEESGEPTRRRMEWWIIGNDEPYFTARYYIPQSYIDAADKQIEFWLRLYAHCEQTGMWHGYTPKPIEIDIPKYFVPFQA